MTIIRFIQQAVRDFSRGPRYYAVRECPHCKMWVRKLTNWNTGEYRTEIHMREWRWCEGSDVRVSIGGE